MNSASFLFFDDIQLEYESLRKMIQNQTFKKNYPKYSFRSYDNVYVIGSNDSSVYIYKEPIKASFQVGNKNYSFLLNSDMDMQTYCHIFNLDINNLFFENGKAFKNNCRFIRSDKNEINLIYKTKKKLTFPEAPFFFRNSKINYKVNEYSNYYKDYFGDNIEPNTLFKYEHTETREIIFKNIYSLFQSDLIKFKFTGPFNIGKSITLLQYSRLNDDVFYINLKLLSKKEERDCYMILLEEFSRAEDFTDTIYKIIETSYEKGKNPIESLLEIMQYLSGKNFIYIFIFDQYKINSFTPIQEEFIKKLKNNIKIVYCSSINNKNIRDECILTWKTFGKSIIKLNKVNNGQEYYYYYSNIYTQTFNKDEPIIDQISKINRFKKLYKENDKEDKKISIVNNHINDKMKKFAKQINASLDFVLIYIKSIINKKYSIRNIESILNYCPLKYLVVEFPDEENFEIKMQFTFLRPIINRRLLSEEVDNYFKNEKYAKLLIESETIKGNYFEEAVKIGLKNNINLPEQIDNTIEVKEIATLEEINKNSLDYYYLEEENSQDDDDSSDEMSNDSDEINIQTVKAKIEKIKIGKRKNEKINIEEIDKILSKFNIDNNNNIKSNPFSENIEYHRFNEILKLYKGKYNIKKLGKNYDGNKTYFLEQKKRTGKTLDCALLYGKEKEKTFIGFQIKCYFEETTSLPLKAKNKLEIKRSIKKILINSMYLLNCKITSWHYYLVFYINKERKNYNVNKSMIEDMRKKNIEVIYYDPVNKAFYDINKKIITDLKLTSNSNLDEIKICYSKMSTNPSEIYEQKKRDVEKEETQKNFIKDFNFLNQKNVDNIIKKILNIMEVKDGIYKLEYKISELPKVMLYPAKNYIYLYKRKNNKGFIGIKFFDDGKNKDSTFCYYDLKAGKEIEFNEVNFLYFYILRKQKPKKIKSSNEKRDSVRMEVEPKLKFSNQNNK